MNLLDAKIIEIQGEPYQKYGCWWVPIAFTCEGQKGTTDVMCETKEDAAMVAVGNTIQV